VEIVRFQPDEAAYRRRVALLREAQPEEPWSLEGERAARRLGFQVAGTRAHLLGPATRPRVASAVEVRP